MAREIFEGVTSAVLFLSSFFVACDFIRGLFKGLEIPWMWGIVPAVMFYVVLKWLFIPDKASAREAE